MAGLLDKCPWQLSCIQGLATLPCRLKFGLISVSSSIPLTSEAPLYKCINWKYSTLVSLAQISTYECMSAVVRTTTGEGEF